jgi:DNA modification methylase
LNYLPTVASGPPTLDTVHHTDLLTLCAALPDRSIDMILCDLPYGTTACSWDVIIPFAPMWAAFKRVIKPRGAIVLTASQPFTSLLVCSNLDWFHEEIVWDKVAPTGFLDVNRKHMKRHEAVLVFSQSAPTYNPQMSGAATKRFGGRVKNGGSTIYFGNFTDERSDGLGYPQSIIPFMRVNNLTENRFHKVQKPVALFEYLIRTYTQPGDVVFDPCVGSGTTAIAARNTGRRWICGDSDAGYVQVAKDRLAVPFTLPLFIDAPTATPAVQMEMGL